MTLRSPASGLRKAIQDQRHLLDAGDVILDEDVLVWRVGIGRRVARTLRTGVDAERGAELIPGPRTLRRRRDDRFLSSELFPGVGHDPCERRIERRAARRLTAD